MPICLIEITNDCNQKCKYCYRKNSIYSNNASLDYLSLAKSIGTREFSTIILTGGEPLLSKETIIKFLEKIDENISNFIILTNGSLIENSIIDELLLCKKNVSFQISLDSINKQIHEKNRIGESTFIYAVNACISLYKKGVKYEISTVISYDNINHIDEVALFAFLTGCNVVHFQECISWDETSGLIKPYFSTKERAFLEKKILLLKKRWDGMLNISLMPSYDEYFSSLLDNEWDGIVIKTDGSYAPDCLIPVYYYDKFPNVSPIQYYNNINNNEYREKINLFLKKSIKNFSRVDNFNKLICKKLNNESFINTVPLIKNIELYKWTGKIIANEKAIDCNDSMNFIIHLIAQGEDVSCISNKLSKFYKIDHDKALIDTLIAIRQLIDRNIFQWS